MITFRAVRAFGENFDWDNMPFSDPIFDDLGAAASTQLSLDRDVRLLPWADRVSWARIGLFGDMSAGELRQTSAGRDLPKQMNYMRPSGIAGFNLEDVPGLAGDRDGLWRRVLAFENHLSRQLRPGRLRRINDWRYRWQLAKSRPTPFPWRV